ncbi:hypothetical protein CSC94_00300 [Zhengella mangrovi]|uniref:DUF2946 domain-containing protein n=1 Tax=Zhengella mangrovi TaxID=1982044 RepID=A0A2G1QSG9_9HYPH|nr:hypothetical protein CSC94_00300 [Zhengella mangrovi]
MRRFLALCLMVLFASVHPGVPGGPVLEAHAAASHAPVDGNPSVHTHHVAEANLTAMPEHSCCPAMGTARIAHGKAGHCSVDGGFLSPAASAIPAAAHRVFPRSAFDRPSEADPSAIPHPPRYV